MHTQVGAFDCANARFAAANSRDITAELLSRCEKFPLVREDLELRAAKLKPLRLQPSRRAELRQQRIEPYFSQALVFDLCRITDENDRLNSPGDNSHREPQHPERAVAGVEERCWASAGERDRAPKARPSGHVEGLLELE